MLLVGCGELNRQYVEADRATYDGLSACVERGIEASEAEEGEAFSLLKSSWSGRLTAAEESLSE